jgi:Fur family transcriptional regulator, peroxide stress response regulator
LSHAAEQFRAVCEQAGLALTHQRLVIWETLKSTPGHPSPEDVYLRVKEEIPSISLATVYKTIHLFIESGIFREVSLHHGSLRVETNARPHHHLVCRVCKSITDIDAAAVGLDGNLHTLPGGFVAERYTVDILGICAECRGAVV